MRGTLWTPLEQRLTRGVTLAAVVTVGLVASASSQTNTTQPKTVSTAPEVLADSTVEALFKDFLHYARLGQFGAADAHAKALLAHPDLDAVELMELANKDRASVDTLLIIIKHSSISESASRVLELIEKGEFLRRQDLERIQTNIEKLAGNPQQEANAIRHLVDGGEYSIPLLVKALLDPGQSALWPRIISALPKIGKPAVNPLVAALAVDNHDVRQNLIRALGEIGYPFAVPYLRKVIGDGAAFAETKTAAAAAIARIESLIGRDVPGSAEELFYQFAERFYQDDETVRADPRLDEANVWYWDSAGQTLKPVVVPRRIFGPVMAMRCCQEALQLRNDYQDAIALWLAANIRRESRLGFNVENGDPAEAGEVDRTRPAVFPRALYFTQAAGPRYAHLVLDRAVRERDTAVALGAIEALRITAGESSLIGSEDYKQPLAQCLRFPDQVVRIKAALALGAALPKSQFADSQFVVPVLASTLTQSGRQQLIVVDADQGNANRVMGALRGGDRDVIAETGFYRAMDRARTEFQMVSGVFLSTDLTEPGLAVALEKLRSEFTYTKTPVVVLTKPRQTVMAEDLARVDSLVEIVDAAAADTALEAALERARGRAGHAPLSGEMALSLALRAADTLRSIAVDGRSVYDASVATPSLISALSASDERLQITAASVLALTPLPAAQRAIAHVALDEKNSKSLRVAAFGSLAESAKNNGNLLEEAQVAALVTIAKEDADLTIRTAASQTLGAVNLSNNKASEIIRTYHGG
jgi:HEAT repeat protein